MRPDRRTDGQTDGRTDVVIPVYPPNFVAGGGYNEKYDLNTQSLPLFLWHASHRVIFEPNTHCSIISQDPLSKIYVEKKEENSDSVL